MAFVYHRVADDMRGSTLYPLHELRARHPEVYERERAKWAGRESVVSLRVPHLTLSRL